MPTLPASDGKDYNFPEGTTADTAMGFLKSKGLSVRSAGAGTPLTGPSASFIGGGASATWEPNVKRSPMRGEPTGFNMAEAEESMKRDAPLIAAIGLSFVQPEIGLPVLARLGIGSKVLQFAVRAGERVAGQAIVAGGTRAGVESASGATNEEALAAGLETGKEFGKYALVGEGVGLTAKGARAAYAAAKPAVKSVLRRLPSGQLYGQKVTEAVNEQAHMDAQKIIDQVSSPVPADLSGQEVGNMAKTFDQFSTYRATDLREIPIQMASRANLKVDIKPVLEDLKELLKASELKGGALTPLSGADARAVEVARGARLGTTDVSKLAERASDLAQRGNLAEPLDAETAKRVEALREKIKAVISAKTANTAALMDIQGTVSQILADTNTPLSLRRVAQRIGGGDFMQPTARLNNIIRGSLSELGEDAVAGWDVSQQYFSKIQSIKEQALYGVLQKSPEKLAKYVVPNKPANVETLRKVVGEASGIPGGPDYSDVIPTLQRQWLEARLAKGRVAGFQKEIDSYGTRTVNALFKEPKAAKALDDLENLSGAVNKKLEEVGVGAEKTRDILATAAAKAGLSYVPGGKIISVLTPDVLLKWAYTPEAPRIAAMINGIGPDTTQATVNALSQLMGRAMARKD